jgi:biotin carboxyl carrier protein
MAAPGDRVAEGQALVVIEAMKMEMTLTAPVAAVVAALHAAPDEMVQEGALLVSFAAPDAPPPGPQAA